MRNFIFVGLLFFCVATFAQRVEVSGVVLDSNNQPIAFATIYDEKQDVGVYSDRAGVFSIQLPTSSSSLTISAIGYEQKVMELVGDTLSFLKVILTSKSYELSEIQVRPALFKDKKISIKPKNKNNGYIRACSSFAYQCGIHFSTDIKGELKRVNFLVQNKHADNSTFRVRVYNTTNEGYPNEDLLLESVIITLPRSNKKRSIQVDLEQYRISIPEKGIVVALEWIKSPQNSYISTYAVGKKKYQRECFGPLLMLTKAERNKYNTWSKHNKGGWFKNTFGSNTFRKGSETSLVPVIGIEIKEYE